MHLPTISVVSAALVASFLLILPSHVNAASSQLYVEEDGVVVIEMESILPAAGWELRTDFPGYTGEGYGYYSGTSTGGGTELIYNIFITQPGRYLMEFYCTNHGAKKHDLNNDLWSTMNNGPTYKTFTSGENWRWGARFDHHPDGQPDAFYDLTPGKHSLKLAGRSMGFHVDRVVLYLPNKEKQATNLTHPETRGLPPMPEGLEARQQASWAQGKLGAVWKWAERKTDDPVAVASVSTLTAHFEGLVAQMTAMFAEDPLAALAAYEITSMRYSGATRAKELKALSSEWRRDPRLKQESQAQAMVSKLIALSTDANRLSGSAQERKLAQLEQGKAILAEKFGDTITAKRYLGK